MENDLTRVMADMEKVRTLSDEITRLTSLLELARNARADLFISLKAHKYSNSDLADFAGITPNRIGEIIAQRERVLFKLQSQKSVTSDMQAALDEYSAALETEKAEKVKNGD